MSIRLMLVIVIVASWAGVGAAWLIKNPPTQSSDPEPPFFYNIPVEDLRKISITAGDSTSSWTYDALTGRWFFEDPANVPANLTRWGGITTLLGGPKTQRVLDQTIDDPVAYGLDNPDLKITASLRDGTDLTLNVGKTTPNSVANYARVVGYDRLVLVDATWGGVLRRLVNEPPYPDWWYTMDPAEATEVLFFRNNDVILGYGMNDDGTWHKCALPVDDEPCAGTELVDTALVQAGLEKISDHGIHGYEELDVQTQDGYAPYEASVDAPYLTVRIEKVQPGGVTNVYRTSMTIGGLTPDETERYLIVNETKDVVRADAAWADGVLELFEG